MLISIVVTLTSPTAAVLPAELGRANYAVVLELLNRASSGLAQEIHGSEGPKPLTCSTIYGGPAADHQWRVEPGRAYGLRVTGLSERVSEALRLALLVHPPAHWTVCQHTFHVVDAVCDATCDPWSGLSSYADLARGGLARAGDDLKHVVLQFASPTAFKSGGMQMPLPLPGLVFGSLLDHWNAFSALPLDPAIRGFAGEAIGIFRFELASQPAPGKDRALRIGATGLAGYVALGGDSYCWNAMQILANFALYSGVGVQTTNGLGQARRL